MSDDAIIKTKIEEMNKWAKENSITGVEITLGDDGDYLAVLGKNEGEDDADVAYAYGKTIEEAVLNLAGEWTGIKG